MGSGKSVCFIMILVIDGIDFCGKDSLAKNLAKKMRQKGLRVIITAYHHPEELEDQLKQTAPQLINHKIISQYIKHGNEIVAAIKKSDDIAFSSQDTIQLLYCALVPLFSKVIKLLTAQNINLILPRSWTSAYCYYEPYDLKVNLRENYYQLLQKIWPKINNYAFINMTQEILNQRMTKRKKPAEQTILKSYEQNPEYLLRVNSRFIKLAKRINAMIIPGELTEIEATNMLYEQLSFNQ